MSSCISNISCVLRHTKLWKSIPVSTCPLHDRLCMELWREVQDHLDDIVTKEVAALGAKPEHVSAYAYVSHTKGTGMTSFAAAGRSFRQRQSR